MQGDDEVEQLVVELEGVTISQTRPGNTRQTHISLQNSLPGRGEPSAPSQSPPDSAVETAEAAFGKLPPAVKDLGMSGRIVQPAYAATQQRQAQAETDLWTSGRMDLPARRGHLHVPQQRAARIGAIGRRH